MDKWTYKSEKLPTEEQCRAGNLFAVKTDLLGFPVTTTFEWKTGYFITPQQFNITWVEFEKHVIAWIQLPLFHNQGANITCPPQR